MITTSKPDNVIVVGGGIVGIACAHYLAKLGLAVTVIDRGTIAGGCSHGNCGYICPSHVLPLTEPEALRAAFKSLFQPNAPFRVKPRFSPALWNWMWQFARRCNHAQMLRAGIGLKAILDSSMHEYHQLIAQEALDCEWQTRGLLYVLQSERGMESFAENDHFLQQHFGVAARRIEGKDLSNFDPALKPNLAGAFHYEGDTSVRPDRLNRQWAARLQEHGVKFVENCSLLGIEKENGRITSIQTTEGKRIVDRVVIATGAWSTQLESMLGCRIPIEPGKGYSVTMSRPQPCPSHPMLFPEHKVGVSPFEGGYRLGSMMEFSGYDTSIPPRRIEQLRRSAEPYLVSPSTAETQQTWYGWRPMTWDSLPIIGPVPRLQNAFLATGHNMLGVSMATATGKLIAEMIAAAPTHIDAEPYSPQRFAS
ncbi:NAD(P)/FAD-dependent oxidoreductase [Blastopirellula marina]|uniref:Amino acid dehydrogenase n=1 Tax=Blastopirellula marina TaxID=124 RepID=A0A2S8G9A4_9BACT|nr:FAD-dependent oxidoreductase [Blastopirellula marina]PQO40684.1 amino acid dehydrogenase [Blastopirellula marina]PTL45644.1 FAD-dependent oxidoreductase [Blastopirellula marina]